MKPSEYLHLQMELEGIQRGNGDVIEPASPDADEFPLVLFASTSDEQKYLYFDGSLPIALHETLSKGGVQSFNIEDAVEVFNSFGVGTKLGHFRTYIIPNKIDAVDVENVKCFSQTDPEIIAFGFSGLGNRIYAIEQEGTILSACVSSRQNSKAAEAWVFTHPGHRSKGFAQQVVTAWARDMQKEGLVPFYSHSVENTNSGSLACKMGLILAFDDFVIEKAA